MNLHEEYMKYAIKLAMIGLTRGDEPIGSIIVYKGEVVGTGIDSAKSTKNITNRAEIIAINSAIEFIGTEALKDALLYSTKEPCIMCSYIIRQYNIPKVIYGISNDFFGGHTSKIKILETREITSWAVVPNITSGILEGNIQKLIQKQL